MPCNYGASEPRINAYFSSINLAYLCDITPGQLNELFDSLVWSPRAATHNEERKDKENLLAWIVRKMPHLKHPHQNIKRKSLLDGSMHLRGQAHLSAGPRPAATLPALPASHRIAASPPAEPASPTNTVSTGRSLDAATTASTRLHCIIDSSEHDCTPVISRAARRTLLPAFMSEAPEHTSKSRQCRKMSSLFISDSDFDSDSDDGGTFPRRVDSLHSLRDRFSATTPSPIPFARKAPVPLTLNKQNFLAGLDDDDDEDDQEDSMQDILPASAKTFPTFPTVSTVHREPTPVHHEVPNAIETALAAVTTLCRQGKLDEAVIGLAKATAVVLQMREQRPGQVEKTV